MPYSSEHSARLRNPVDFETNSFRRTSGGKIYGSIKVPNSISIIWGKLKGATTVTPQALRFDKTKWTADEAKKWLKDNNIKYIVFEAAAAGKSAATMLEVDEIKSTPWGREKDVIRSLRQEINFKSSFENGDEKDLGKFGGGTIIGYAATWDVDRENERFVKGAFLKSIKESVPAGKIPLMVRHIAQGGSALDVVAEIVEMKEDNRGLWYRADFFTDEIAQAVRQKAITGKIPYNSVGFYALDWRYVKTQNKWSPIIEITQAKLAEVTLTLNPVNPKSVVLSAKSFNEELTSTMEKVKDGTATEEDKTQLKEIAENLRFTSDSIVDLLAKPADNNGEDKTGSTDKTSAAPVESKPSVSPRESRKRDLERLALSV